MNAAATDVDPTPWYRQRWPWLVMTPPIVAIIGCAITIVLAVKSADGVVAADYYKRGLAINEQLARSQAARQMGLQAQLQAQGLQTGDSVRVRLSADAALAPEAALRLRLVHPGRGGADRVAMLARVGMADDGRSVDYAGSWGEVEPINGIVNWRLVLEARDWRLDGDASMIQPGVALKIDAR